VSRTVQLVLLCEDSQHETFARRFLGKAGWSTRRLRIERVPPPRGSGAAFVRDRFPEELSAYRANRHRVAQGLIVLLDGDSRGVDARLKELESACRTQGIDPRTDDDKVAIFIPTWRIETWLAYLGGADVDETSKDYPKLDRPRDCQQQVNALWEMYQRRALRQPAPPSLEAACAEYQGRMPS